MIEKNDWRLQVPKDYLKGQELRFAKYTKNDTPSAHTHCDFCFATFSVYDGDLHEGYFARDGKNWICPICYNDFKEMFGWKLVEKEV
ncbi:MAG: hypothetical protein LBL34_06505 [Clostridiales bacterium]|nr:hypothetical protein [Clostridiales bacterium]